jgi:hypothetical protein
MKALVAGILSLVLVAPAIAQAQHFGPHRHFHHHGYRGPVVVYRDNWVGPLVGGVVLGAIIADVNRPTVVQQPPVVVQQPPIVLQQPTVVCTEWKETMQPDGVIVKERTCYQK